MKQIDADSLKLKVQRYLMPNVDDDGTVSIENAERYFLNLIDKEEEIKMKPIIFIEIDFEKTPVDIVSIFFEAIANRLNKDNVEIIAIPKGVKIIEKSLEKTNSIYTCKDPVLIYKDEEYSIDKFIEVVDLWQNELQMKILSE